MQYCWKKLLFDVVSGFLALGLLMLSVVIADKVYYSTHPEQTICTGTP